mmetsp:Transcript_42523/g.76392  ORF Transcript_42523/g.76392 Transcript_42523/m.76392 type:complete len:359 (+) Transcript_42523:38-1114(+)
MAPCVAASAVAPVAAEPIVVEAMNAQFFFAIYAGVGWAFGQLGKRYGAVDEKDEAKGTLNSEKTQLVIDSCVSTLYLLGASSVGLLGSLRDISSASAVLGNAHWRQRIPVTMSLGVMEGLGSLISVVVVGYAGRHRMSTIAPLIMNSLNAISAPVLLAFLFGETLSGGFYAAMLALMLGILLASGLTTQVSRKEEGGELGPGVVIAIGSSFVAILWSCGALGARYIMDDVPQDLKTAWSSVSYAFGVMPMLLSPVCTIVANGCFGEGVNTRRVLAGVGRRSKVCILCGMLAGTGGLSLQLALAGSAGGGASLVGLSQGVYNISCVLLFKLIYQEPLSWLQTTGILIMLIGIVTLSVAK